MKLKEFIENLNEFVKENPEALEMEVIYSSDDEGNDFQEVYFGPTIGYFEDRSFVSGEQIEEVYGDEVEPNSVCIN